MALASIGTPQASEGWTDRIQEGVAETSQGVLRCCGGRVASAPNPSSASVSGRGGAISAQK